MSESDATSPSQPKEQGRSSRGSTTPTRSAKQKSLSQWTRQDVLHWLKKHIGEGYYIAYSDMFKEHDITGRTLQRLNESGLVRMGMKNQQHRNQLLKKIVVLKLKSDMVELQNSLSSNSPT